MQQLSFHITPSPESDDHQVRILVDGNDFLGKQYLGIDPHDFFAQQNPTENGSLMIGRCTCGCEGCDDYAVTVNSYDSATITWKNRRGLNLVFDKITYVDTWHKARQDHSWEDVNRTVERLINNILHDTTIYGSYKFDWASARVKANVITLSYSNNDGNQKLFEIPWDGQTEQSAITNATAFKSRNIL